MKARVVFDGAGERLGILGIDHELRLTGADTGGQFEFLELHGAPGLGVPSHQHSNEDEVFHVVEGSVRFAVGGEAVDAGPGTTVFAPRQTPHSFEVAGESAARILVTVTPAGLEPMFRELAALPEGPPDLGRVAEICGRYGIEFFGA